jgi:cystathionine gamma-synthase
MALRPESIAAQALGWIDEASKALAPALQPSTTFIRDADNQYRAGYVYARDQNVTFDQVEAVLAALEQGHASLVFASGMAAATAVFQALTPGDHVLAPKVMYWSLRNWLHGFAAQWGLRTDFIDMSDPGELRRAIRTGETKLVWVETPANPLWTITDIAQTCDIAHAAGAAVAVDSTAATPVLTQPLALGADVVMHSATKYLNGHSDVIAGALVTREDSPLWQRIGYLRTHLGGILGTFEAWLLLRGMRTLYPRVRQHCGSAMRIAQHFAGHRHVAQVLYPGLPQCAGHETAARQMTGGFGGMLSIRARGGEAAAIATAAHVELWKRATSLGGVESLMEHRASVEGAGTPVPADLLRLSVGLEDAGDLIADLDAALAAAHR